MRRLHQNSHHAAFRLEVGGRPLLAAHEQIAEILRSRLGRDHAELLASPSIEPDGSVSWSTALPGDVIAAKDLPEQQGVKLRQRAERLLSDIRGLGAQMRSEAAATALVGQMVEQVASVPSGDWLYSVGNKPVLVMWGEANPVVTVDQAREFTKMLDHAASVKLIVYPGVGHMAVHEAPEATSKDARAFLDGTMETAAAP